MGFGFSLIELLLSLSLSLLIVSCIGSIWGSLLSLRAFSREHECMIDLAVGMCRWSSDVQSACTYLKPAANSSSQCILKMNTLYCGWVLKKGKLMRYLGDYCSASGSWKHRSTSMVMGLIDTLECRSLIKGGRVVAIELIACKGEHLQMALVCGI